MNTQAQVSLINDTAPAAQSLAVSMAGWRSGLRLFSAFSSALGKSSAANPRSQLVRNKPHQVMANRRRTTISKTPDATPLRGRFVQGFFVFRYENCLPFIGLEQKLRVRVRTGARSIFSMLSSCGASMRKPFFRT